jgi:hypothetical protein
MAPVKTPEAAFAPTSDDVKDCCKTPAPNSVMSTSISASVNEL